MKKFIFSLFICLFLFAQPANAFNVRFKRRPVFPWQENVREMIEKAVKRLEARLDKIEEVLSRGGFVQDYTVPDSQGDFIFTTYQQEPTPTVTPMPTQGDPTPTPTGGMSTPIPTYPPGPLSIEIDSSLTEGINNLYISPAEGNECSWKGRKINPQAIGVVKTAEENIYAVGNCNLLVFNFENSLSSESFGLEITYRWWGVEKTISLTVDPTDF